MFYTPMTPEFKKCESFFTHTLITFLHCTRRSLKKT